MKAIILAAGQSSRLYPLTLHRPKGLLDIGGNTIIGYQLSALRGQGINDIVVVTGFCAEQFHFLSRESGVKLIYNPDYARTNNLYSFWCAREELNNYQDEVLCLHADLIFHPRILHNCLKKEAEFLLVIDQRLNPETMRVRINQGRVTEVGKEVPLQEAGGVFTGMAKFSSAGIELFLDKMQELVGTGQENAYFTAVFNALSEKGMTVDYCSTAGYPWIEVDTLADLERLRSEIYPAILSAGT